MSNSISETTHNVRKKSMLKKKDRDRESLSTGSNHCGCKHCISGLVVGIDVTWHENLFFGTDDTVASLSGFYLERADPIDLTHYSCQK